MLPGMVDRFVAACELLQEKRQALITQAAIYKIGHNLVPRAS